MSSKILVSGDSPGPQRVVWRKMGAPTAVPVPAAVAGPSAGVAFAPAEADSLRSRLHQVTVEAEARERKARQQGFQEGEAAAAQKFAQQWQQAIQRMGQSVEEFAGARLRMRQQMEQDVVHLAVEVARRIVHRELTVDPGALLGIVKAALQKIEARELQRIRVAAADARLLEQHLAGLPLPARVEIAGDAALPRGSVILETVRGRVDSSVDTQLEEIDRGFADLVGHPA